MEKAKAKTKHRKQQTFEDVGREASVVSGSMFCEGRKVNSGQAFRNNQSLVVLGGQFLG